MIIVTGGAGFIGSNIVKKLCQAGHDNDIVVVDDLTDGEKFRNIVGLPIADYIDLEDLPRRLTEMGDITAIIHQGAISNTRERNGALMMQANYEASKLLANFCLTRDVRFLYASSAAVYGTSQGFKEVPENEHPINVYAYSKLLFDQWIRRRVDNVESQIVGLRYFNVYGPGEAFKYDMASVAYKTYETLRDDDAEPKAVLFDDGEQLRDFVYVDDVVDTLLWFMQHEDVSGIFNVGTGKAASFNQLAQAAIDSCGKGEIEYTPMPDHMAWCYQAHTEADIGALRKAGCDVQFRDVATGVADMVRVLDS